MEKENKIKKRKGRLERKKEKRRWKGESWLGGRRKRKGKKKGC